MRAANPAEQILDALVHPLEAFDKIDVVLVTSSSNEETTLGTPHQREQIYENRMSYAIRHGYGFMWANSSTYVTSRSRHPPHVAKLLSIREAFARYPEARWVWYLPPDAIIMTPSIPISRLLTSEGLAQVQYGPLGKERLIDSGDVEMIAPSGDTRIIEPVTFLIRRGHWADWAIERWMHAVYPSVASEAAWEHKDTYLELLYETDENFRRHVVLVRKNTIGSAPNLASPLLPEAWQQGELVVMLRNCASDRRCASGWQNMWKQKECMKCQRPSTRLYRLVKE